MVGRRAGTGLVVVSVATCVVGLLICRGGLTRSSFDRIQVGMVEAEVSALLGCPPGNYASHGWRNREGTGSDERVWYTDSFIIVVYVSPGHLPSDPSRVTSKHFVPVPAEGWAGRLDRLSAAVRASGYVLP